MPLIYTIIFVYKLYIILVTVKELQLVARLDKQVNDY